MDYILGVDGGGTKTIIQVADFMGSLIAESEFGSSNYKSVGIKIAKENINKAIFRAINKLNNSREFTFKNIRFVLDCQEMILAKIKIDKFKIFCDFLNIDLFLL